MNVSLFSVIVILSLCSSNVVILAPYDYPVYTILLFFFKHFDFAFFIILILPDEGYTRKIEWTFYQMCVVLF